MELDYIIKKRKSTRSFKNKKPSWKLILNAIDSANQNPFAGNRNNIRYLIIENSDTIKKIAKLAEQTWITESKLVLLVCSDDTHLENQFGERGRIYSRQQAGAAIQTLLLKLTDLKLSSCWVGAYTDETIKQNLKIPQHIQIEAIIPIGYENPKKTKSLTKKIELENTLSWETWGNSQRPNIFKEPKDNSALSS